MQSKKLFLEHQSYKIRELSLLMTTKAGSGHPTSCFSIADIVSVIFFYAMRYNPNDFNFVNNDRFILSQGHSAPVLYIAWHLLGKVSYDELMSYRTIDSFLEGHPTMRFSFTEVATGSLGIGLSAAAGMALSAKMDSLSFKTFVIVGDGELAEGSNWEAASLASYYKLDNLICFLDCNRLGQSDETMHGYYTKRYEEKLIAFGWKTFVIDGHNIGQLIDVVDKAMLVKNMPIMIIAKTVKGKGLKSIENKLNYHGKAFSQQECDLFLKQLLQDCKKISNFEVKENWLPKLPDNENIKKDSDQPDLIKILPPTFKFGSEIATRKVFGRALVEVAKRNKNIISLDGDVKNSTYAQTFEEKYKDRFIQCFVAEQNMVSMAVGMHKRGKIPFVSTFGAFMSRAHDQIRMAAIGKSALRLVGSHAGVSIGQDGPSQMALEDIAMMCALPDSIVLYPADAVSTHKLVEQMANYNKGISYLRTTRMDTPVIYDNDQNFVIGGCKIIKQSEKDQACIIAAGITVHEALKAYNRLKEQDILVSIIDLYSIKPFDVKTVVKVAKKSGNKILTVEDHYIQGGIGQIVAASLVNSDIQIESLAVTSLPKSASPEELLSWAKIDAAAIVKKIDTLITK